MITKHFYIKVTPEFCKANEDLQNGASKFGFTIGKDGNYYTSANSLNEFPEVFGELGLEIVALERTDFPDRTPKG